MSFQGKGSDTIIMDQEVFGPVDLNKPLNEDTSVLGGKQQNAPRLEDK